ncbi:MAG TPA: glycerol-3-phosphate acyltransferase [Actinomycetota bacterium]|jgi:glycerol-3-phosphate acyltransferase PlsY|nr:glycerol-3-phosphate acyltransferase [Actinomycetota bacterium]
MTVFLWALIGYASGSLPSAWIVAVLTHNEGALDRVRRGVGETDAHLLLKRAGGKGATVAAAMDVVKGFAPVVIATQLTGPYEVAACAVAAVAGHCWPPLVPRLAGRGLASAAGAFLGFVPIEMVVAGIIRIVGSLVKAGGLLSTIGFVTVPLYAWYRGRPLPYVIAAVVINVLIFVRRLEGLSEDLELGMPVGLAVVRRVVLDASAHPQP